MIMKVIELLPSNFLPPLPELLPVGSMTSAHSHERNRDGRSSNDDEIIVIYENIPSKPFQDSMNHDIQVVPLDLSPRMGEPSKKQHRYDSPTMTIETGDIQIRADLFKARAYNNLHNEAKTRLLGLAGLTRGSDIHQAYDEVLRLKISIDERMEDVAGIIGEGFTRIDPPKLKEVSPVEDNQNETGLQQPPEPQPVARDQEQQRNKMNAFGLLEHRGANYLSGS